MTREDALPLDQRLLDIKITEDQILENPIRPALHDSRRRFVVGCNEEFDDDAH
ncbi:hypothetical protein [Streptomyces halstedii]|uniref:hypothetical protein n=1 Tax=Streptomyces halstedii TaxID=1944 RepID=UPI0033AB7784